MQKQIIDFFPYFDQTGRELLELRITLLKDYVDKFIICESNKTHSGIPLEYNLEAVINELNLPKDKIEIIRLEIPEERELPVELIDIINCYENNKNPASIRARTRERLQKDSILQKLDQFSDNTLFIISDSDELVNPSCINWITDMVLKHEDFVIKIPLVHLEGRADLRVHDSKTTYPKSWDGGMFICTKKHLLKASPTQIRSNVDNPFPINYLYHEGKRAEDLGWHFSWMGTNEHRAIKRKSFTHYNDSFSFIKGHNYNGQDIVELHSVTPKEGDISPSGEVNTVLKRYSIHNLPNLIFELPRVKKFLLPEENNTMEQSVLELEYYKACSQKTDINEHLPVLKELASTCQSVTEMGTRDGQSTRAFLVTNAKLTAYDLELDDTVKKLFATAKALGKNVTYTQADVLSLDIDETDLLFIDTWHTYDQLNLELKLHGNKAKKYLAFHDTHTYGVVGEGENTKGLLPAVIEFLIANPHWRFKIHKTNNNGLTVLERTANE